MNPKIQIFPFRELRGLRAIKTSLQRTAILLTAAVLFSDSWAFAEEKSAIPPTNPAAWKAGIAKVVITPEKPVWLAGYGTKRVPDGKLHDIWMKALALEDPTGHRAVLITSDFQGVPKSMSDPAFEKLQKQFK